MSDDDPKCKECGAPADPTHTMDFTDVVPGKYLHWCAVHGPTAHEHARKLDEAFRRHGREMVERMVAEAEREIN